MNYDKLRDGDYVAWDARKGGWDNPLYGDYNVFRVTKVNHETGELTLVDVHQNGRNRTVRDMSFERMREIGYSFAPVEFYEKLGWNRLLHEMVERDCVPDIGKAPLELVA